MLKCQKAQIIPSNELFEKHDFFTKRAEQLSVQDFIELTTIVENAI